MSSGGSPSICSRRRQAEGHHLLGTPRCLGGSRQTLVIGQRIQRAGLAGIGAAGERHLGALVGGKLADAMGGEHELRALKRIRDMGMV